MIEPIEKIEEEVPIPSVPKIDPSIISSLEDYLNQPLLKPKAITKKKSKKDRKGKKTREGSSTATASSN